MSWFLLSGLDLFHVKHYFHTAAKSSVNLQVISDHFVTKQSLSYKNLISTASARPLIVYMSNIDLVF